MKTRGAKVSRQPHPPAKKGPATELHVLFSGAGFRDWLRGSRHDAVPVAILALTVVYPSWARLRSGAGSRLLAVR